MVDYVYTQSDIDKGVAAVRALAPEYYQGETDNEIIVRVLHSAGFYGRMAARATLERNQMQDKLDLEQKISSDLRQEVTRLWRELQDHIARETARQVMQKAAPLVDVAIENPGVRSALAEQNLEMTEKPKSVPDRFVTQSPQFDYQIVADLSVLGRAFVATRNGGVYEVSSDEKYPYIYRCSVA